MEADTTIVVIAEHTSVRMFAREQLSPIAIPQTSDWLQAEVAEKPTIVLARLGDRRTLRLVGDNFVLVGVSEVDVNEDTLAAIIRIAEGGEV